MNILLSIPAIVWLLISAFFFAIGEYISKLWGAHPSIRLTILAALIYVCGTFTWLPSLLHKNQLAIMGTVWLLLATLATIFIGVIVFHEHLNTLQIIGVIMALVAMIFLNIPKN